MHIRATIKYAIGCVGLAFVLAVFVPAVHAQAAGAGASGATGGGATASTGPGTAGMGQAAGSANGSAMPGAAHNGSTSGITTLRNPAQAMNPSTYGNPRQPDSSAARTIQQRNNAPVHNQQ